MTEHRPRITSNPNLLIIVIAAVIILLGVGAYHVRHTQAFVNATTHQPERYTELFFTNPTKIPNVVSTGTKLPVSFTVHNVEARTMSYSYTVTFTANGSVLAQQQGNFNLTSNGTNYITSNITIPGFTGRGEVQVTLINLNQSIHYWVINR